MSRILVVDDDSGFLTLLAKLLSRQGFDTIPAANGKEALEILQFSRFDLMVSDISMLPIDGMELLHRTRETYDEMGIILLTANGSIDTALDAMRSGAFDYLTKPFKIDELLSTVQHALEYQQTSPDASLPTIRLAYRKHAERLNGIVTECPAMLSVCDQIKRLAPTDFPVLICGERGSGKTLVAYDLHRYGPRRTKPLQSVNCAALAPPRLEAALFGSASQRGLLENASGGTVLLEQIDRFPSGLQFRLLDFLQGQNLQCDSNSGGSPAAVRILATAGRDLEQLIEQGHFRHDLYDHLCSTRINIPPMRRRPEDLLPIISQKLHQKLGDDADTPMLNRDAEAILNHYTWPGNVRELEDSILYALSGIDSGPITKASLPPHIVKDAEPLLSAEDSAASGERYKARSLKAFLREKEKELLAHIRGQSGTSSSPRGTEPRHAPAQDQVSLVNEKSPLYFPPHRLNSAWS
ncbi:MAG: sigma-54-dependent Fis family transcriptional regulator [Kiritimatiellales bacterium]|nr:sigma-54-dependent Fis family transcriptional regulator [Kiritimatiellota bacterium]MBL7012421.1 sigma-54-dependent Fis family transcriptional regulator [Kiritimatiellales bacterium]